MIKVLGLALYGPLAASTRYRLGQYVPGLSGMGIDLQIQHLLGDDYLRVRFKGGRIPLTAIARAGLARLADLWHSDEYDVVILHCEMFPLIPGWMERALIRKPYIYDFDDAFYLKYQSGPMAVVRPVLGRKFDTVMAGAAAVTAGNHVLADYARLHNADTQYLPTVVDTERYVPQRGKRGGQVFTVGWIGSPSTAPYLSEVVAPLSTIGLEGRVRFIVIGGRAPFVPNVSIIELDWTEDTELDLINSFDVGVMPLPDTHWARGKCAFKIIQYMACAVPVVASAVGANIDVLNAECGFLASTPDAWTEALRLLRDREGARVNMGNAGRARAVQHYSLNQNLPKLADLIINTNRSMN